MNLLRQLVRIINNKYVIVSLAFIIWLSFFDTNSLINQHRLNKALEKVEKERAFYISEIQKDKEIANDLMSNEDELERYAREKFLMKRDNEDVYIIIEESKKEREYRLKN